jgi:plasmid maintenance system killer protein
MEAEHDDPELAKMETDTSLDSRYPQGVAKKYRWVMQQIRIAAKKSQLYQIGSLRLKKLEDRGLEERMWINDKYRLEMVFEGILPDETVRILRISNHYGD